MGIIRFPRASRPRSQWALIDPGQYRRFNREKINLNDKGATMRSGRPTRESTRSDQIVLIVTVVMTLLRLVDAKDGSRTGPGARALASDLAACWSFSTSPRKQSVQVPVGLSPRRSPEKRVELARFSHGALRPLPHPSPTSAVPSLPSSCSPGIVFKPVLGQQNVYSTKNRSAQITSVL